MYLNANNPDLNPRVTQAVIRETGEDKKLITEIWNQAIKFTSESIRAGEFRAIRIPHMGKFAPNMRVIDNYTIRSMIPKAQTNEPIHDQRELRSGTEQGMDHDDSSVQEGDNQ